ncbi:MAG: transcriptional repressor [Bacteroidales bacterium]|nr:transcriptional repressor [Bacteroidales bacterium]
MESLEQLLQEHGVKPTANRLLIANALQEAPGPMTMMELEAELETIDKSNVFRALTAFREAHLVHVLEDTGEGIRYELCHSHGEDHDEDLHVHFYCTRCHRTYCLENLPIPAVEVPEGYLWESANYLIKGICPACRRPANLG